MTPTVVLLTAFSILLDVIGQSTGLFADAIKLKQVSFELSNPVESFFQLQQLLGRQIRCIAMEAQ